MTPPPTAPLLLSSSFSGVAGGCLPFLDLDFDMIKYIISSNAHDCGGGRSWFFGLFEALDIFSLFSQILIS